MIRLTETDDHHPKQIELFKPESITVIDEYEETDEQKEITCQKFIKWFETQYGITPKVSIP